MVLTIFITSWDDEEESRGVGEGGAGRGALEVGVWWLVVGGGESLCMLAAAALSPWESWESMAGRCEVSMGVGGAGGVDDADIEGSDVATDVGGGEAEVILTSWPSCVGAEGV